MKHGVSWGFLAGCRELALAQGIHERPTVLRGEVFTGHHDGAGNEVEADGAQAKGLLQRAARERQFLDVGGGDDLDAAGEAPAVDHDGVDKHSDSLLLQVDG